MKTYYFDDYGAMSNGAFDCTAIWNKIIAEINIGNAVIEFGSGTYLFKNRISLELNQSHSPSRFQTITLKGQGKGVTNLLWNGGDNSGLYMSHYDSGGGECRYNIHDISFITIGVNQGTAIHLENKNPYRFGGGYLSIRGVSISGDGGQYSGDSAWAECVNMTTISFNNFIDCDFIGNFYPEKNNNSRGVIINSSQGSDNQTLSSIVNNFTDCNFLYLSDGITNGVGTQGLTISQSNFTNCKYGVCVPDNGYQISIATSQFDCTDCAIFLSGGTTCFLFNNNLVFTGSKNGCGICCKNYVDAYIITGNQFEGAGTESNVNAIVVKAASPTGMNTNIISGNIFRKYTTAICLNYATRGWKIFGNMFALTSNTIVNQGENNSITS